MDSGHYEQLFLQMVSVQVKYRGSKKEQSTALYSVLPETEEMKVAKAAMEIQSEVSPHLSQGQRSRAL